MVNLNRKTESIDTRFRSRVCSNERSFCSGTSGQGSLIMFIGDKETCVGSTLKGHLRYGGRWKPKLHAVSPLVKFTNKHKASQTCMYCFNPIMHPLKNVKIKGKTISKAIDGAFLCLNSRCVSVKNHRTVQSSDKTSALAIAVSGLSYMIFNETLPVLNPYTSQSNTRIFSKTTAFCKRNGDRDSSDAPLPID
jgi:hypothetical protein